MALRETNSAIPAAFIFDYVFGLILVFLGIVLLCSLISQLGSI